MPPVVVSPPRKMMKTLATVFVTGGSSGAGKSFIKLMGKLQRTLLFCNPSWHKRDIFSLELKPRHVSGNLGQSSGSRGEVEAVLRFLDCEVPEDRRMLINSCEYGSYGRLLESDPAHKTKYLQPGVALPGRTPGTVIEISLRAHGAGIVRGAKVSA